MDEVTIKTDKEFMKTHMSPEFFHNYEKEQFLRQKFENEIKKIKNMKEYLSYFMKIHKFDNNKLLSTKSISNIMEVLFNPKFDKDIIIFHNGGGSHFDIWDFEKGTGKPMSEHITPIASLIDGEFKMNGYSIIPHELYNASNYDYVLENF